MMKLNRQACLAFFLVLSDDVGGYDFLHLTHILVKGARINGFI